MEKLFPSLSHTYIHTQAHKSLRLEMKEYEERKKRWK